MPPGLINHIINIMKELEKWISKLNKQQKLIAVIGVPLILFFLTVKIAGAIGENFIGEARPYNFDATWWVWLIFVLIVGFLEFKFFENKEGE